MPPGPFPKQCLGERMNAITFPDVSTRLYWNPGCSAPGETGEVGGRLADRHALLDSSAGMSPGARGIGVEETPNRSPQWPRAKLPERVGPPFFFIRLKGPQLLISRTAPFFGFFFSLCRLFERGNYRHFFLAPFFNWPAPVANQWFLAKRGKT